MLCYKQKNKKIISKGYKVLNTHPEIKGDRRMHIWAVNNIKNMCLVDGKHCECESYCSDDWLKEKEILINKNCK